MDFFDQIHFLLVIWLAGYDYTVKDVTWILIEIPCHSMSQIDGSLVEIDTKFHVIYPGFICFPCWNMTWILHFTQDQVMEFPWHLPRK